MPMPSWYECVNRCIFIVYAIPEKKRPANDSIKTLDVSDIDAPSFESRVSDEAGILRSIKGISDLITNELDQVPSVSADRFVIGGFSQGAVMALCTGLTTERSIAGIAALSGYVALPSKLPKVRVTLPCASAPRLTVGTQMATDKSRKLPVFWGHGTGACLRSSDATKLIKRIRTSQPTQSSSMLGAKKASTCFKTK